MPRPCASTLRAIRFPAVAMLTIPTALLDACCWQERQLVTITWLRAAQASGLVRRGTALPLIDRERMGEYDLLLLNDRPNYR